MQTYFIELSYLLASVLFILGLKGLSHPETAKRGMHLAEFGMLMAIIGTLLHHEIVQLHVDTLRSRHRFADWFGDGSLGADDCDAATHRAFTCVRRFCRRPRGRVGVLSARGNVDKVTMGALGFEVMLGALTTTGKFARLCQTSRPGARHTNDLQGPECLQHGSVADHHRYLPLSRRVPWFASLLFFLMAGLALVFGLLLVMPIGSADMPVVMSLLNSYAGLASAATGFVLNNKVLIIAGTLDGFSGFILSILMCRAMNRSMTNVLFGAFRKCGDRGNRCGSTGYDARSWS